MYIHVNGRATVIEMCFHFSVNSLYSKAGEIFTRPAAKPPGGPKIVLDHVRVYIYILYIIYIYICMYAYDFLSARCIRS